MQFLKDAYNFLTGFPTWVYIVFVVITAICGIILLRIRDKETADIEKYVESYVESWVKAINTYSFVPVANFFEKGSQIYNQIKDEYKDLTSAGAKLELVSWDIRNGEAFSKAFYDSETKECTIRLYEEYNVIGRDGKKDNVAYENEYKAKYLGTVEPDTNKRFRIVSKRKNVG